MIIRNLHNPTDKHSDSLALFATYLPSPLLTTPISSELIFFKYGTQKVVG
jgi:hypothetical protein